MAQTCLPVVGLRWCNLQQENWLEPSPQSHDGPVRGSPPSEDACEDEAAFELDMRLEELQATAKRMGCGIGLKFLGAQGFVPLRNLRHPDFDYFQSRQS